ncbi:MAG: hypothetical protein R3316_03965 [Rhodovibrionaceae bacterium]|nr:hypothetical protein [Rhodovibrionaceae bacterium]
MSETSVTEVVGRFSTRENFQEAVKQLQEAGFGHEDISVLDTHESLEAAGDPDTAWRDTLTGMVGEVTYIGPITAAGLIALAAGPVGSAVAGLTAAGLTGAALHRAFEEIRATPHTHAFAEALKNGALLVWVYAPDEEQQAKAREILERNRGQDVHTHTRPRKAAS